jgi:hypothetical protein
MSESRSSPSTPESTRDGPSQDASVAAGRPGDAAAADRRASIWDVLHGLEVRDFTETLPSDVWEQLFPGRDKRD